MGRRRSSASREDKYGWYEVEVSGVCLRFIADRAVRVFSSVCMMWYTDIFSRVTVYATTTTQLKSVLVRDSPPPY